MSLFNFGRRMDPNESAWKYRQSPAEGRATLAHSLREQGLPSAELEKQVRTESEPVPGVVNGQLIERPIPGVLSRDAGGVLRFSGIERAVASATTRVLDALTRGGGNLNVQITPIGSITGTSVNHTNPTIEIGRMAYRVTLPNGV